MPASNMNMESTLDLDSLAVSQFLAGSASQDNQPEQLSGLPFDKEWFLQALRQYKCLWDTSDSNYKNRNMKVNSWTALSLMFRQDVLYLQKTYKNLKDSLKKCLDKRKALTQSGAAASTLPTCKYFEVMKSLHEKTSNLLTHSNLDILDQQPLGFEVQHSLQREVLPSPIMSLPSPAPSNCSTLICDEPPTKRAKGKEGTNRKTFDDTFFKQIDSMDERFLTSMQKANKPEEKDEATTFFLSLVPALQDLDKKKLSLAKIKIQQPLIDLKYSEEDN